MKMGLTIVLLLQHVGSWDTMDIHFLLQKRKHFLIYVHTQMSHLDVHNVKVYISVSLSGVCV